MGTDGRTTIFSCLAEASRRGKQHVSVVSTSRDVKASRAQVQSFTAQVKGIMYNARQVHIGIALSSYSTCLTKLHSTHVTLDSLSPTGLILPRSYIEKVQLDADLRTPVSHEAA